MADAPDEQKKLATDLFNQTVGHSLKVLRLILSLQDYLEQGLPAAHERIFNTAHQVASEFIARPDFGTPEQRESVSQSLPNFAERAASATVEDAYATAGAACIVFAHSMLDGAVDSYCKVSNLLSPTDWESLWDEDYKQGYKVTLGQLLNCELGGLLERARLAYFNKVLQKKLLTKIQVLHFVCKPGSAEILTGYRFDGERIDRIDRLRHDIVHQKALGLPIENVSDDLEYIERTNIYLSALITHRYGLRVGPEAMMSCFE